MESLGSDEATWAAIYGAIPDTDGQTALWLEHQAQAPTLADVERAARDLVDTTEKGR